LRNSFGVAFFVGNQGAEFRLRAKRVLPGMESRGEFKEFAFGYGGGSHAVRFFELDDDYLAARGATAFPREGEYFEWGEPSKHFIIVHSRSSKEQKELGAVHEHVELLTGKHEVAAQAERAHAESNGWIDGWMETRLQHAVSLGTDYATFSGTIAVKEKFPQNFGELVAAISRHTALTEAEVRQALDGKRTILEK
jgi:hypothetical protein